MVQQRLNTSLPPKDTSSKYLLTLLPNWPHMPSVPRSHGRGSVEVMKSPVVALKEKRNPRSHERGLVEALAYADAVGSKVEEPAAARLQACSNSDPLGHRRDAFGQIHVPAAFALVHL